MLCDIFLILFHYLRSIVSDDIISRPDDSYPHTDNLKLFADDGFVVGSFEGFFSHEKGESFFDGGDEIGRAVSFRAFVILVGEVFCEIGNA